MLAHAGYSVPNCIRRGVQGVDLIAKSSVSG